MRANCLDDIKFHELIQQIRASGEVTVDALFSELYDHIWQEARRQIAREWPIHTLQATELVNEAYLRLRSARGVEWQSRQHALRVVARAIRHVLIDWARRRKAKKHGGDLQQVTLVTLQGETVAPLDDIIALDRALDELSQGEGNLPREAQVIELYFFAGARPAEIASILGVTERQVYRDYRHAKTWLYKHLSSKQAI